VKASGKSKSGKPIGRPKIKEKIEQAIREVLLARGEGFHKIASRYGVGTGTVQRIKATMLGRCSWKTGGEREIGPAGRKWPICASAVRRIGEPLPPYLKFGYGDRGEGNAHHQSRGAGSGIARDETGYAGSSAAGHQEFLDAAVKPYQIHQLSVDNGLPRPNERSRGDPLGIASSSQYSVGRRSATVVFPARCLSNLLSLARSTFAP
jgi:hypothetical protein